MPDRRAWANQPDRRREGQSLWKRDRGQVVVLVCIFIMLGVLGWMLWPW